MNRPSAVLALALAALLAGAGCTVTRGDGSGSTAGPTPAGQSPSPDPGPVAGGPKPSGPAVAPTGEPGPRQPFRVTADWTTRPVAVSHPLTAPPLRYLEQVRFGDHPGEDPAYSRVTFAFDGGFPSYDIRYVPAVEQDGSGDKLELPGNAFVRIVFRDARAHDDAGKAAPRPPETVGYPTLRGYRFGGDFEGHVTFGLGLQVAANSDQVLPIRVGELVRADGSYVVAVDVRR